MKLIHISSLYLRELERTDYEYIGETKSYLNPKHTKKLPKELEHITKVDICAWVDSMRAYLAPKTIKAIICAWRRATEFAIDKGLASSNPFDKAKHPKIQISKISPFSKEEVSLLLANSTGKMNSFLGIAFHSGARICEILALEWDDINFEKKSISIAKSLSRGFVKNRTKTGVDREIPLFDQVLPYLKELEKTRDSKWLFSSKGDHLFGSYSLYRRWSKLCKECGVEYRSLRHTRHTFATHMVEKAVQGEMPLKWVSQILGHSSLDMTIKVYARFIKDEHLKINRGLRIF